MLKSFNATPAKSVSNSQAPLAPLNLLRAGVPVCEVVWFRQLRPDRQMAALSTTTRGKLLLEQVRQFAATQGSTAQAMPPNHQP